VADLPAGRVRGLARRAAAVPLPVQEPRTGIPKPVGQRNWGSGPLLGADVERGVVADLSLEEGVVTAVAVLDEATRKLWGSAALQARPVLLRGLGYPLLGVRLIASYLGEVAVIDALVDVGDANASEVFVKLSQTFRLQLHIRGGGGQASTVRDIDAEPLRRNAQMCLESAQGQLGTGEFPPDAYQSAREALGRMPAKQRLEPARASLAEGAYRHLVGPAETLHALERLDHASKKDNLARLLEVDGLPVPEYEAIRKAVLAASLEFGLVAPARFWRRVLGSDLVQDAPAWIHKLVSQRCAWLARGDDLTSEQAEQAWRGIFDLCTHHDLTPPPEVVQALGLGKRGDRSSRPSDAAEARDARSPSSSQPAASGRPPASQRPTPTTVRPTATAATTGSYPVVGPSSRPPAPASEPPRPPSSSSSRTPASERGKTPSGSYPTVGSSRAHSAPPTAPRRSRREPRRRAAILRSARRGPTPPRPPPRRRSRSEGLRRTRTRRSARRGPRRVSQPRSPARPAPRPRARRSGPARARFRRSAGRRRRGPGAAINRRSARRERSAAVSPPGPIRLSGPPRRRPVAARVRPRRCGSAGAI
jgi:hypothetical protein